MVNLNLEEEGSFMIFFYLLIYIVLPCFILYLIVYSATKKALFESSDEVRIEDERISQLIKLRDKDIIDNNELELMVEVINNQIKIDTDKAAYKNEKRLLQALLSNNIIDEDVYEDKKARLKQTYKLI